MRFMKTRYHRILMLFAGVCWVANALLLISPALSASLPQPVSSPSPMKPWVQFELNQPESMGNQQAGKPVTLKIVLRGLPIGRAPVVATCESKVFYRQTVTLEPDVSSLMVWKGMVTLEPISMSRTFVPPKAARVRVTFARSRLGQPERFLRRAVYITLDQVEPMREKRALSPVQGKVVPSEGAIVEEVQEAVTPVSAHALIEEDVGLSPSSAEGKAYWQQVSRRINQSWARQIQGVQHALSGEIVKVHFKLYPYGRAQLIEIEKGSGVRAIDEAGIYAVVHAQPFPSFSGELGDGPADVHVRMRTGIRIEPLEVAPVGSSSSGKSDAPGRPSKK